MSIKLSEFIKQIRAAKTAAEERGVVAREAANLRQAFKDGDPNVRHRNAAKLMYMHMLGYPSHFGQMECAKLIATSTYPEKRIGYLALMVLLDERTEVLMLVTNLMKNDMNQKNQYIAGLALSALGNVGSLEMVRDLAPDVERLLASTNAYIRKKAALCAVRVIHKVPELAETFVERAGQLLLDRSHGVLLAGTTLMLEICRVVPEAIPIYRKYIEQLVKVLRTLLSAAVSPEHSIDGVQDPFLQVRILQLLRTLGKGDADASDKMSDVLAQVATNIDPSRNAANAVLYECVQTIMGVESIGGLRLMAINILGKFLANKDNNMRYVALNTLARVVAVDAAAVARHRTTIVECVRDSDVSIRRRALDLVYGLVNQNNIATLSKELLEYLAQSDKDFQGDLTTRLCQLVQRYAPSKRWQVDTMCRIFVQAGAHVKDDICRAFIVTVTNTPELYGYATRQLYRHLLPLAASPNLPHSLAHVAVWCLGEFGDLLYEGDLQEGEPPLKGGPQEVLACIETLMKNPVSSVDLQGYCLTALVKLSTRINVDPNKVQALMNQCSAAVALELQQRSCEYLRLLTMPELRAQLLDRMPPLDENSYAAIMSGGGDVGSAAAAEVDSTKREAEQLAEMLQLDLMHEAAPAAPEPAPRAHARAPAQQQQAAPAPAAQPQPQPRQPQQAAEAAAAPAAAAPAGQSGPLERTALILKNAHCAVGFQVRRDGNQPSITHVRAAVSCTGSAPISGVQLQVAVPKYCQLRMDPASVSEAAPGGAPVLQVFHIANGAHGEKPPMVRLRLVYSVGGEEMSEQANIGAEVLSF